MYRKGLLVVWKGEFDKGVTGYNITHQNAKPLTSKGPLRGFIITAINFVP